MIKKQEKLVITFYTTTAAMSMEYICKEQGAVRFSFSHYNTKKEIDIAVSALRELALEE